MQNPQYLPKNQISTKTKTPKIIHEQKFQNQIPSRLLLFWMSFYHIQNFIQSANRIICVFFEGFCIRVVSDNHKGLLASTGDNGNTVYQLLSGDHYDGWLRILTFVPDEDKIYVKSYSPWQPEDPNDQCNSYPFSLPGYNPDLSLPGYNPDQYHQYELTYDMNWLSKHYHGELYYCF